MGDIGDIGNIGDIGDTRSRVTHHTTRHLCPRSDGNDVSSHRQPATRTHTHTRTRTGHHRHHDTVVVSVGHGRPPMGVTEGPPPPPPPPPSMPFLYPAPPGGGPWRDHPVESARVDALIEHILESIKKVCAESASHGGCAHRARSPSIAAGFFAWAAIVAFVTVPCPSATGRRLRVICVVCRGQCDDAVAYVRLVATGMNGWKPPSFEGGDCRTTVAVVE